MNASNFLNIRYAINDSARLSISSWDTSANTRTYAVALFRRFCGRWVIDHDSAQEFTGVEDFPQWYSTQYAATLVAKELGECPLRFFRDNAITTGRARQSA